MYTPINPSPIKPEKKLGRFITLPRWKNHKYTVNLTCKGNNGNVVFATGQWNFDKLEVEVKCY